MDYTHFMGCALLGCAPAMVIFFLLRAKRRAWIPCLGWWLSLAVGVILAFYAMSHSTTPSFSARITMVGKAYDYTEREIHSGYHHDTIYSFRLVPEGKDPIQIETEIILPDTAHPTVFNGRTLRIVYLADSTRVLKNEAVDIAILSGANAGFHDSLDARLAGTWIGIPVGVAFLSFGLAGLRFMKEDAIKAASEDD